MVFLSSRGILSFFYFFDHCKFFSYGADGLSASEIAFQFFFR